MTQLSDNRFIETPEEKEAFERIEREQQINAMVAVIRTCPVHSWTGIATLLFNADCRMKTPIARK
jgi:hypothetical protein